MGKLLSLINRHSFNSRWSFWQGHLWNRRQEIRCSFRLFRSKQCGRVRQTGRLPRQEVRGIFELEGQSRVDGEEDAEEGRESDSQELGRRVHS